MLSQKGEAVASSRVCVTEPTADCWNENLHSDDTGLVTNVDSMQPVTLTGLKENQQQEERAEPDPSSQDFNTTSVTSTGSTDQGLYCNEEETTTQACGVQDKPAELPTGSGVGAKPGAAAEDANEEGEKEAPADTGENSDAGKAKMTHKRRSGRAASRR